MPPWATATARPGPYSLAFQEEAFAFGDSAYRRFTTEDSVTGSGLAFGRDLTGGERRALAAAVGWWHEGLERRGGAGLSRSELAVDSFHADLSPRFALGPWVAPFLRLSGGVSRGALTLTLEDGQRLKGEDWQPFAQVGAGARFQTGAIAVRGLPTGHGFALALTIEGGYSLGAGLRFSGRPTAAPSADEPVRSSPVALGTLDRRAPYGRLTLGLLF